MNDQTIALIQELAAKLGTTTEHLLGVLIAQARVEFFAMSITYLTIPVLFGITFFLYKKHMNEKYEVNKFTIPMLIVGFITAASLIGGLGYLPMYLASILNPEYWALKQILK